VLATAADWQVVADTKLGQLRLDNASVTKEGKFTKAMLIYEFKELQSLTTTPHAVFNKRQDDILVDCSNPSLGVQSSRFFEDSRLSSSFSLKAAEIKFNPSAPGNMVETVVNAVCAAEPKSKH
jgi:hypothetical protein